MDLSLCLLFFHNFCLWNGLDYLSPKQTETFVLFQQTFHNNFFTRPNHFILFSMMDSIKLVCFSCLSFEWAETSVLLSRFSSENSTMFPTLSPLISIKLFSSSTSSVFIWVTRGLFSQEIDRHLCVIYIKWKMSQNKENRKNTDADMDQNANMPPGITFYICLNKYNCHVCNIQALYQCKSISFTFISHLHIYVLCQKYLTDMWMNRRNCAKFHHNGKQSRKS